ncbi:hypothetical protein KA183_07190 [bacterium]|nr:hypothetical protein [bacterium]
MKVSAKKNSIKLSPSNLYSFLVATITLALGAPAFGQAVVPSSSPSSPSFAPITLNTNSRLIAQQLPSTVPTDVTPIGLGRERELIKPGPTFYLLQRLPSKMWLNASLELSQRGETNVYFASSKYTSDYVFRTLPNLTVGYRFLPNTSIYGNYFVLKDVFATQGILTKPTTQSLSWGLRHEKQIGPRTNLQFDLQARELWQTVGVRQFDFLPGVTLTHVLNPSTIAFGNIQLQMRGGQYFVAPTREIDPFYTVGLLHRRGPWTFSAVDTFVTNFRNQDAIPQQGNVAMICQFETSRTISKKIPGLVAFVRSEPIWNWDSRGVRGLSGFDHRIFTGLRYSLNKTATSAAMNKLREQLQESSGNDPLPSKKNKSRSNSVNRATPSASPTNTNSSGNSASDSTLQSPESINNLQNRTSDDSKLVPPNLERLPADETQSTDK